MPLSQHNIRINPIDLPQNDKIAVGVPFPFDAGGVFHQTFTTKEQVKSNLINLFLTDKGERPMMPTFGIGIRKLLFEQNIQKEALQIRIEHGIELIKLNINKPKNSHVLTIQLVYSVLFDRSMDSIELNFQ